MGRSDNAFRFLSRRAFARTLAGAALGRLCAAAALDRLGRLEWDAETGPALTFERHYRADAQVLLFGLTLLHRENVGGGSVLLREFDASNSTRLIEFAGFSTPQRAAGLNRMGYIRELGDAPGAAADAECIYFGLMTASPEESAEEARRALHPGAKEQTYTAIEGRTAAGETATSIAHFTAPAALSGANREELAERARRALVSAQEVRTAASVGQTSNSFLQELATLLMRPGQDEEGRYIYSGRPYHMHMARSVDAKATAYFRERRLISSPAEVVRVTGRVRREAGGKTTEFRLWIPTGAERPLPLRIEYQAKSYLNLIFEAPAG